MQVSHDIDTKISKEDHCMWSCGSIWVQHSGIWPCRRNVRWLRVIFYPIISIYWFRYHQNIQFHRLSVTWKVKVPFRESEHTWGGKRTLQVSIFGHGVILYPPLMQMRRQSTITSGDRSRKIVALISCTCLKNNHLQVIRIIRPLWAVHISHDLRQSRRSWLNPVIGHHTASKKTRPR